MRRNVGEVIITTEIRDVGTRVLKEFIVWPTGNWYVRSLVSEIAEKSWEINKFRFPVSIQLFHDSCVRLNNNCALIK